MKKAIVTAIAIALLFISSFIQTSLAIPGAMISVKPSDLNVSPGEEFTVNITVDPDGVEIGGVQYDLYFDPDLLNATSQTKGTFLSQDGVSTMIMTNAIINGKAEYSELRKEVDYGVTTSGVLATITFKAIKPGTSSLSLSYVVLSNPVGEQIDVSVNDGTCDIGTTTPTPSPTPTPTSSGSGDNGNGDASVTPTPTSTPLSSGEDNRNSNGEEPVTPMQTPTINPVPSQSPSPSPTITMSPTSTASMPLSGENKGLPGFEAVFVIAGLLVTAYLILKRKEGGDR